MINAKMDTDAQFRLFLKERLQMETYKELPKTRNFRESPLGLLGSLSTKKVSSDILIVIEEFLASLPFEEASEYVSGLNFFGNSILLICEDINLLKLLIKYVPDINASNEYGNNALMRQFLKQHPDLEKIQFLLESGIDVNATNSQNMTALMLCCGYVTKAVNENISEILEVLIFSGANVDIQSNCGKKAYCLVPDKTLLSERMSQLLQGTIRLNGTKRAARE